jgi:protein O-GlcNAc transferase
VVSATTDILLQRALAHHQIGQLPQAEALYRQILKACPDSPDALHLLGMIACQVEDYAMALELIDKAILFKPGFAQAYDTRGSALHGLQQYHAALGSFDKAILLKPNSAEAYNNRGNPLLRLEQYQAALDSYDKAILLKPNFAEAYRNRGSALLGLKHYQAALDSCDKAILLRPEFAEAYDNRGSAFYGLRQYQAAVESCDKAILLKPEFAEAYNNRGSAFYGLRQYQAAVESCEQAVLLKPNYAEAYSNRGSALFELHQYQAAVESCDQAILLKPNYAEAYSNRGGALNGLQQHQAALESSEKAIQLKPGFAQAYNNRGSALFKLHQYLAALESFDRAIQLKPDFADAYNNRGNVLQGLQRYQSALESFDAASLLMPNYEYLPGMQLQPKQFICEWEDIDRQRQRLEAGVDRNEKLVIPFVFLTLSGSAALQKKVAEIYVGDKYPPISAVALIPHRPRRNRIRIGYFSTDYHNHATSYLMAELFERHDRSRFEILGFSFGLDIKDEMSERVSLAMDRFLDVRSLSDEGVAQLSRQLEVDIAVDLKGFTEHSRMGIFARRAAPIQVNYLGFPATTGAPYMDYLVADHTLIPEASQRHYSEKIVYLPDSYQVNDSTRRISTRHYTRAEEGLPERGFVYCCFNNNYKITPDVFDIWMSILSQVEGSILWLLKGNLWAAENLRKEALRRGISQARLIFAERLHLPEHLARHSLADLFLDTFPCNAHTTASDALWAGLPVLTRTGETFASRVAASLLGAIDLPELVTTTETAYEKLAVEFALDAEPYLEIKKRLQRNRLTSPLFDLPSFTKHLEAAYSAMYERYQAHLPPEHIHITGLPN